MCRIVCNVWLLVFLQETKRRKASDSGGLVEVLRLGVGARVMLRRNKSLAHGLVNGARGTVTKVVMRSTGAVDEIHVLFDGHNQDTVVVREVAIFEEHSGSTIMLKRKQFPLVLAWAITIHKSQGQ